MGKFTIATTILLTAFVSPLRAAAHDDEIDWRPGLVVQFTGEKGVRFQRIDETISYDWSKIPVDPRLEAGKFSAQWKGRLFVKTEGKYQFKAHVSGSITLRIDGKVLLREKTNKPTWVTGQIVSLDFGLLPIVVDFEATADTPKIALYWSGPQFGLEPIESHWLFHAPSEAPPSTFERGRLLNHALRCGACHDIPLAGSFPPAPALDRLAGNMEPAWLVRHLRTRSGNNQGNSFSRRMPYFDLSEEDAKAVTAFLWQASDKPPKQDSSRKRKQDVKAGRLLFRSLGCLACHTEGDLGKSGLFGGGDLSEVADKRPASFFLRWLKDPAAINRDHRMPVFEIEEKDRVNLAAYLASLKKERKPVADLAFSRELAAKGKEIIETSRCGSCHRLPNSESFRRLPLIPLHSSSNWEKSCLSQPDAQHHRPGYSLASADQAALKAFISQLPRTKGRQSLATGDLVLAERNCLACHARGAAGGIADQLPQTVSAETSLATLLPALTPPSLNSVGDKLHADALLAAIRRTTPDRRPWLKIRMPRFPLSEQEAKALVDYFVTKDRIPDIDQRRIIEVGDEMVIQAGRLVTADGFGCLSCHPIGKVAPAKGPLGTRGPQLLQLGQRIRRSWFDRFVRNPARIVPNMEMPSVQLPVQGVLDGDIDRQLAAVWSVLNRPDFIPPRPNPVRIVRHSGNAPDERAFVLTDVLRYGGNVFIKPWLIGLPNRHNILIDLETNRLAAWWIGDTARQHTEGKTWFWEAAGVNLLPAGAAISELALVGKNNLILPELVGQFPTEIDRYRHVRGGLEFERRLVFPGKIVVHVKETLTTKPSKKNQSGFVRRITVTGMSDKLPFAWRIGVPTSRAETSEKTFASPLGKHVELHGRILTGRLADIDKGRMVVFTRDGSASFELAYETDLPVDRIVEKAADEMPPMPVALDVVPGYEATRLPLPNHLMPTGFAWKPDGTLVITSLKGRVWLARDTDGDGLEDQLQLYSDELAAPYGAAAYDHYVDVVNKYALLRLFDDDGDGRADRVITLASGWGHTDDYHDWAIGLPRDDKGSYYIALACQQDNRSPAAAHLRGKVIKLDPRQPTADDPRLFHIELVSGGHRFPMGLARNKSGALFATDNQGNWNPYNELNHVIPGARYGFINAIERKRGFQPDDTPPAIAIPHPWTRSVNGICFLETPTAVARKRGGPLFGPFENHIVGCEYDTRRLVRMSLQKVGNTYQGAVYPFSYNTPKGKTGFLGPVACGVAPDGSIYIGEMRDSGWGGGNNIGAVVRLTPKSIVPGIAEVQAERDGFLIRFTKPVDVAAAGDPANYSIFSARRLVTSAYGGKDIDRRSERFAVQVHRHGEQVKLRLKELRIGFVYEFRLKNLTNADTEFFPAEAYFTLRKIP
ncbi:MAG: hypothetical protein KatS3mg105_1196 [Gemmatales bacterium]|nr:MAG: hypothetical protein KatS3mg105_1196 [Gemmatales bacterium]